MGRVKIPVTLYRNWFYIGILACMEMESQGMVITTPELREYINTYFDIVYLTQGQWTNHNTQVLIGQSVLMEVPNQDPKLRFERINYRLNWSRLQEIYQEMHVLFDFKAKMEAYTLANG